MRINQCCTQMVLIFHWCPCAFGGQINPIKAPSILRCCLGHLLNGLYSNTICSKSGSQSLMQVLRLCSRLLVSNEIAYIQPQPQCQLFDAPNASSHLISSHFIHIGCSIFLCSLAICPSLSFIGYLNHQIKTIFHTPSLRP